MSAVRIVNIDSTVGDRQTYAHEINCWEQVGAELILEDSQTEDDLIAAARGANILLVEGRGAPVTCRVIQTLDDCWLIAKYGVGVDDIDTAAATEHRIIVCNLAEFCIEEVSDHATALLLASVRRIPQLNAHVHAGGWRGLQLQPPVRRAKTLTVGLVGLGSIGRLVARKLGGFQMRIIAADPYVSDPTAETVGVELVPLDQLLSESDLVSIHAPLTEETRHLIGISELQSMKESAFLVNTSRGPLVDEEALVDALRERWIAGAALDVTETEPLPDDSPLRGMDNVILTPHQGGVSEEAKREWHTSMAKSVTAVIRGYWPPFPVNPEVRPKLDLKPHARFVSDR